MWPYVLERWVALTIRSPSIIALYVTDNMNNSFLVRHFIQDDVIDVEEAGLVGDHTHAYFLDLGSDCLPELALMRSKGTERWLDIWSREEVST